MEKTKAKGRVLLLIVGILLLIGSALGLFTSVSMLGFVFYGAMASIFVIMGGITSVVQLIASIVAINKRNSLDENDIKKCQKWGVTLLIVDVIYIFIDFLISFSVSSVAGLLLPILYLVGVYLNKTTKKDNDILESISKINNTDNETQQEK